MLFKFLNQPDRIDGMDDFNPAHNRGGLVPLQMANEVPTREIDCLQFGQQFLSPVFTELFCAGFEKGLKYLQRMRFRDDDEHNLVGFASGARGGCGDARLRFVKPHPQRRGFNSWINHQRDYTIRRPLGEESQLGREQVSIIIPTFNEEKNLEDCLKSVAWGDEIVVVDSFSTDRTPEIARRDGIRFLQHEYVNSATQKNWIIPQAAHPWVLIVDADERVTPELRNEILRELERPGAEGYRIGRQNFFLGKKIRFSGWQNDSVLRLFRRDKGRYQDRHVHADVILDGKVGRLKNKLLHHTFESFEQYLRKYDRYTSWAARDRGRSTSKVRWDHLALRPFGRFLRHYVLRFGFLDGKEGLVISTMAAYSVFLKYAKLWEIQQKLSHGARNDGSS